MIENGDVIVIEIEIEIVKENEIVESGTVIEAGNENENESEIEIIVNEIVERGIEIGTVTVIERRIEIGSVKTKDAATTTVIEIEITTEIGIAIGIARGANGIINVQTVREEVGMGQAIAIVTATETVIEIEIADIAAIPKIDGAQGCTPIEEVAVDDVVDLEVATVTGII